VPERRRRRRKKFSLNRKEQATDLLKLTERNVISSKGYTLRKVMRDVGRLFILMGKTAPLSYKFSKLRRFVLLAGEARLDGKKCLEI
jgi:hypothetical protein